MDRPTEIAAEPLLAVDISADYPQKPGVLESIRFSLSAGEIMGLDGLT